MVPGTWNGIESYNIELVLAGQPPQFYSGTESAVFDIFTEIGAPAAVTIRVTGAYILPGFDTSMISMFGLLDPQFPFGPTSASASFSLTSPPLVESGDFSLTYQSIGSNGLIDVGDGSALAHLSYSQYTYIPETVFATVTFQTVPEPSTIVLATIAALAMSAVGLRRARR